MANNKDIYMSERARFEKWSCLGESLFQGAQDKGGDWFYFDAMVRDMWIGWRARAQAGPTLEEILNCYSPDDTAGDYQDKISALFGSPRARYVAQQQDKTNETETV